jgi:hypothetical protein
MLIPRRRILGVIALAFSPLPFGLLIAPDARTAPIPPPGRGVHTYRFTARIRDNGGLSPFKVGGVITGTFTYDLQAKTTRSPNPFHGHYQSARNSLTFQMGDLRFIGTGDVLVTVGAFDHAEHFQVVAFDLTLPKGWEMDHTGRSQTYSVLLQNAPPRKIITSSGIPGRLSLPDFVNTKELRLDFFHGVRFPGGQAKEGATVYAVVESLK